VFVNGYHFASFCVIVDHVIPVLFAFVVFDLVLSVLSQEIRWEERLRDDIYLRREVRNTLTQSINNRSRNCSFFCAAIRRPLPIWLTTTGSDEKPTTSSGIER